MENITTVKKKEPVSAKELITFIDNIDFELPKGFIEFFSDSNGATICNKNGCIVLWPLTDMIKLNKEYFVNELAPGYFIFGSDGGDIAYCIEKETAHIYDMPFVGMLCDVCLVSESFTEFLKNSLERVYS